MTSPASGRSVPGKTTFQNGVLGRLGARWIGVMLVTWYPLVYAGQLAPTTDVAFKWAVGATSPAGGNELIPIKGDVILKSGDQLTLRLESECRCYFLVLFESAAKELTVLIPQDITSIDVPLAPGRTVSRPGPGEFLTLDDETGMETIHIIASAAPLTKLTALLKIHASTPVNQRAAIAIDVLTEIRRIKQRQMNARAVERPVSTAGTTRGLGDITAHLVDVSAKGFYSRTLSIDHR